MATANKRVGEAEIELNGQIEILKLDFNGLYVIEETLNQPIGKIFTEDNIGVRVIRTIIYAGLLPSRGRRLTPEAVGRMLDFDKLDYYGTVISELLTSFYSAGKTPEEKVEKGNEVGKTKAVPSSSLPTGTNSSALPSVVELDANFGI